MIYYIKVTPEVARRFCNPVLRNRTKDGNILLWMGDLNQVPGDTLKERANYVGGALLTTNQANDEYWGYTDDLAGCYTPDYSEGRKITIHRALRLQTKVLKKLQRMTKQTVTIKKRRLNYGK